MKILLRFTPLLAILFLLTGCIKYEEVEMLGVEDVKMVSFKEDGVVAEIAIKVKNPNGYKISVAKTALDIYINGKSAGKAKIKDKLVFPKNSTEVHRFQIEADYKQIMASMKTGLFGMLTGGGVKMGLKGDIKAKAFMISKKVPVDVTETVSMSDMGM